MQTENQAETMVSSEAIETFENRPMDDAQVAKVKRLNAIATAYWTEIENINQAADAGYHTQRLTSLAKTSIEQANMWAVKAVSRQLQARDKASIQAQAKAVSPTDS